MWKLPREGSLQRRRVTTKPTCVAWCVCVCVRGVGGWEDASTHERMHTNTLTHPPTRPPTHAHPPTHPPTYPHTHTIHTIMVSWGNTQPPKFEGRPRSATSLGDSCVCAWVRARMCTCMRESGRKRVTCGLDRPVDKRVDQEEKLENRLHRLVCIVAARPSHQGVGVANPVSFP